MKQSTVGKTSFQSECQIVSEFAFQRAIGSRIPLRGFKIVDRNKSWFASHCQTNIAFNQIFFDNITYLHNVLPLLFGIGFGDSWVFINSGYRIVKFKFHLANFSSTRHGSSTFIIGSTTQRNMTFAGKKSRSRIESNPTSARQIHFYPSVQIGKIFFGTRWAIQRFHIRSQLHQISRNKSSRQADTAQSLHQQPGKITTGTTSHFQCFFTALYTHFKSDIVIQGLKHQLIGKYQKINCFQVFDLSQLRHKSIKFFAFFFYF